MRSKTCTEPNPTKPPTHHTKPQIIVKNSHPILKNLVTTRGRLEPTRKNKSDKKSVSTIMNNNYKRIVKVITTSIGLP